MNWFWYLIGLLLTCQCFGVFAVCYSDLLDLAGECLVIFGLNETVKGNMLLAECKRGNLAVCIIHEIIHVFKSKAFYVMIKFSCVRKFSKVPKIWDDAKNVNQAVFEFVFHIWLRFHTIVKFVVKICHKKNFVTIICNVLDHTLLTMNSKLIIDLFPTFVICCQN